MIHCNLQISLQSDRFQYLITTSHNPEQPMPRIQPFFSDFSDKGFIKSSSYFHCDWSALSEEEKMQYWVKPIFEDVFHCLISESERISLLKESECYSEDQLRRLTERPIRQINALKDAVEPHKTKIIDGLKDAIFGSQNLIKKDVQRQQELQIENATQELFRGKQSTNTHTSIQVQGNNSAPLDDNFSSFPLK